MVARKEIDWIGMWFKLNKEIGAEGRFCLGKVNLSTNEVTWYIGNHAEMDGLGWMLQHARKDGYNLPEIKKSKKAKVPPFYERPVILYRALKNMKKSVIPWKEFYPEKMGEFKKELAWTYFTKEETKKMIKYARSRNYTVPAFFIKLINDVVVSKLVDGPYDGSWMFPVNMRGKVDAPSDIANQTATLMIRVNNNTTPVEISNQTKKLLKKNVHWGNWWISNIGKIVGISGMRIISKIYAKKTHHFGTYTHVGHWPLPGTETEETKKKFANDVWIGAPVGSPSYPISVDTGVTHGIMTLGLKVHVSILTDQSKVDGFVKEIKETVLEMIKDSDDEKSEK